MVQTADKSRTVLACLSLNLNAFQSFECDDDLRMAVHMDSVLKIMKCANTNDILTIRAEQEGDYIFFEFKDNSAQSVSSFEIRLLAITEDQWTVRVRYALIQQMVW